MNITFVNLPEELATGTPRALKKLHLQQAPDGLQVTVIKGSTANGDPLCVKRTGDQITIRYPEKIHYFRALGLLAEQLKKGGDFIIEEIPQFDTSGVMPDLSFGSPLNVKGLCKFLDQMAVVGLNMMLLYIEDLYEMPNRPYFGHLRGRYSPEELRAIDDYAFAYGIEVIPCMQTLGHMAQYLKWPEAEDVKETHIELNVDKEETYRFIEEMMIATTSPLRSRRIHVGLDEVWTLGRSPESLKKYGLRSQEELFLNHLEKVAAIADRLGLQPMIWNDFIFCLHSTTGYSKYQEQTTLSPEIMARFPKNVQLVYWHYGEETRGCDEFMIRKNQLFGNDVIFAGGFMSWRSALPDNQFSYTAAEEGLLAAKKCGLREVFTTLWTYSTLGADFADSYLHLQQYAEHTYHETVSEEHLAARFEACTGASYEAFMQTSQFGNIMDGREYPKDMVRYHGQKYLWQDVLLGEYEDFLYQEPISGHYEQMTSYYAALCEKKDDWFDFYDRCRSMFHYMTLKTYIAENLKKHYDAGDRKFLVKCELELFPELYRRILTLHNIYRKLLYTDRKPFGGERLDNRFGSMEARIQTAIYRLHSYNNGEIDSIGELEEARLPM